MHTEELPIFGMKRLQLAVHYDARGHFVESYNPTPYGEHLGTALSIQQQNVSFSTKNVLRGLHYQRCYPQAKLIRVLKGQVYDVVVDMRPGSSTFMQHYGQMLYGPEHPIAHEQLWLPRGLAHGFYVVSDDALVEYACDQAYAPGDEVCLQWNDPDLAINWPLSTAPQLSPKDAQGYSINYIQTHQLWPTHEH